MGALRRIGASSRICMEYLRVRTLLSHLLLFRSLCVRKRQSASPFPGSVGF